MNGTDQNQTLDMNRFHEVVKDYRSGKDIITDTIVAIRHGSYSGSWCLYFRTCLTLNLICHEM